MPRETLPRDMGAVVASGYSMPALLDYASRNACDPDRARWAGLVAAAVTAAAYRGEVARVDRYRAAVAAGDDAAALDAIRPTDLAHGYVPRWAYRATRWHRLLTAAAAAGVIMGRDAVAAAVLDDGPALPHCRNRLNVSSDSYRWTDYLAAVNYAETRLLERAACDGVAVPYCDGCDNRVWHTNELADLELCARCLALYDQCGECGDAARRDDMAACDGYRYCEPCAEEYLNRCTDCGRHYPLDDEPRCSCISVTVHDYGYKPSPVFHYLDDAGEVVTSRMGADTALVLGVEIELESCGYWHGLRALDGADWLDSFAYLKRDGSLCEGVEIVTHPATVAAWRTLAGGFSGMGGTLADHGWDATDACGIHVHVDRDAFSGRAHLARFAVLWHHWRAGLVATVAGRENSDYATWTDAGRRRVVQYALRGDCPRYSPVNFLPGSTVEVRSFASTTDVDVLLARVETVAAAVHFAGRVTSADIVTGRAGWDSFVQFLDGEYPTAYAAANDMGRF